jgi:hypothetical protein
MHKDIFEGQLETAQRKLARKQERATFRKIDAEIKKLSDAWISQIMQDMEAVISREPDPEMKQIMTEAMESYLDGFREGYYLGFLRQSMGE